MKTSDLKVYAGIYIDLQENLSYKDKIALLDFVTVATESEVINLLMTGEMKEDTEIDFENIYEGFAQTPIPYILTEAPGDIAKGVWDTSKKYWGGKAKKLGKAALDKAAGVETPTGPAFTKAVRVKPSTSQQMKQHAQQAKEAGGKAYDWLVAKANQVKANPEAMQGLKIGAAAAVAALAIFIARKVYKQHLSKTARMCAKDPDKQACIRKVKVEALNKQVQAIQSNGSLCDKSKNPAKCKAKIQQQVNKKKAEIQKVLTKKKVKV